MNKAADAVIPAAALPITVSHPDKVFWPEQGYTKLDLVEYYQKIFPLLEPFVKDRLLTLERCPDGMVGECFYQKQKPMGMPAGTPTKRITGADKEGKVTDYVVGGSLVTQLALANLGCIAVHAMGSCASTPRKPDWVTIDIDPSSGKFHDAVSAALQVKDALDILKLDSYPKTSGSRGIHVMVPIVNGPDSDEVLAFAEAFCSRVAAANPEELTVAHRVADRGKRVYLDPFRNGFAQTVVMPYSVRRREKAPISTPLLWSEIKPKLEVTEFHLGNSAKLLRRADPWAEFFNNRQPLKDASRNLNKL